MDTLRYTDLPKVLNAEQGPQLADTTGVFVDNYVLGRRRSSLGRRYYIRNELIRKYRCLEAIHILLIQYLNTRRMASNAPRESVGINQFGQSCRVDQK